MRKIKSMIFALVMVLSMVLLVAGCGNKTTKATTTKQKDVKPITVKSITASETQNYMSSGLKMAKLNAPMKLYDEPTEQNTETSGLNYFVIFKSKHNVTITITVDNPMDVQIDMAKLSSNDENAKVRVWNNQEAVWQKISEQPVVGWNGSSVYVTTYDLETTKDADEVIFTITDFKVNGDWQQSEDLGNNILHVYKISDNDIQMQIVSNGFNNNNVNDPIEKIKIVCTNENITIHSVSNWLGIEFVPENEIYTITKEEHNVNKIIIKYAFKLGNTGIESKELSLEFDIKFAKIEGNFVYNTTEGKLWTNVELSGDGIPEDLEYKFYYEGVEITPEILTKNDYKYMFTNSEWVNNSTKIEEDILKVTIKINNVMYKIVKAENRVLTIEIVTE